MSVQVEALFTSALGLVPPWQVEKVELDTARRRIDFEVRYNARTLACPRCGALDQRIHDRLHRSWRHLDFFQFEAWLHADVPRVAEGIAVQHGDRSAPEEWFISQEVPDAFVKYIEQNSTAIECRSSIYPSLWAHAEAERRTWMCTKPEGSVTSLTSRYP